MRKLGTVVQLAGKSITQSRKLIRSSLAAHGLIKIPNLDLNPKQMVDICREVIGERILLPPELAFNNIDPDYNYVCRVGNVRVDGSIIQGATQNANYWHQDGDFWEQQTKLVVNLLHSKIVAQEGGETLIFDVVQANDVLKKFYPEIYKKMQSHQVIVDMMKIDDFKNVKQINLDIKIKSKHPLIKKSFMNGRACLNLSYNWLQHLKVSKSPVKRLKIMSYFLEKILNKLLEKMSYYTTDWQVGDLLIWDNNQVIHRSKGPWKGKRLMLRIQGDQTYKTNVVNRSWLFMVYKTLMVPTHYKYMLQYLQIKTSFSQQFKLDYIELLNHIIFPVKLIK